MRSHFWQFCIIGLLALSSSPAAFGQPADTVWQKLPGTPQQRPGKSPRVKPAKYKASNLNRAALQQKLSRAPLEVVGKKIRDTSDATVALPMPDGTMQTFRFVESPIMEPGLAAKFPEIKTYLGEGIDDPSASVRFDVTPNGFHAQILSPKGAVYIDPYYADDSELHVSYFKRDYPRQPDGFVCLAPAVEERVELQREIVLERSGTMLRTYRLACAATAEYTQFHGGTVAAGMAAIVTAVNRVNQVYEQEVSVRLILVANNDLLVFTSVAGDGYSNDNGSTMLGQNQTKIDSIIGSANYDIGHVFSTGGGGVAYIRSVCNNTLKAGGVTGLPTPVGDPFYIDYVAHEMGHQFGGNHTFNSSMGACGGGNRNAATAYEPGSGSSIQAYAGICGTDDLQPNSDPYFHSISFDEIVSFTTVAANACAGKITTGNAVPSISAGANFTIPRSTPFTLTATGSDPNGEPLTYCWEERDLGLSQTLSEADNGSSPLFRSFNPTVSPSRVFPKLSSLLGNSISVGEKLPTTSRTMQFRVTARDNRPGGGGVNTSDMQVTVQSAAGPFLVTAPNSSVTWSNAQIVTWSVAGTVSAPVNATQVNILLSTNGGMTFPIVLKSNTLNDGSERIVLPNVFCSTARVKVEAVGNIFFDVSNTNFTILTFPPQPEIVINSAALIAESCTPNSAIDPGETVSVDLALRNEGSLNAVDISARLLATGAVVGPSAAQSYGELLVNGVPVSRPFTFQAAGACGTEGLAIFEIKEGLNFLGYVTNKFTLGNTTLVMVGGNNPSALTIPLSGNSGTASTYPSTISLAGINGTIAGMTVTLSNLSHANPDDLDIMLVGPGNQKVMLMSDAGAATDLNNVTLVFSDSAVLPLADAAAILSGTYKPSDYETGDSLTTPAPAGPYGSLLAQFNGANPNGIWSLYIVDDANPNKGSLANGWSLAITVAIPTCCGGNTAPTISSINDQFTNEDSPLVTSVIVNDVETPAGSLVITATSSNTNLVPNGAINVSGSGTNRTITIVPNGNQSGASTITLSVSDENSSATTTFLLTVASVNDAPVLATINNRTVNEQALLVITNVATDVDSAVNARSFSVSSNAPAGLAINPTTGVLTWTPSEVQGPGVYSITVSVSDNGSPNLTDSKTFQVTVNEVNSAPVLGSTTDRTIHAGTTLVLTNSASDADLPTNGLGFSLLTAPATATINSASGLFSWTPTDLDADSTNTVTIRLADNGAPVMVDTETFLIHVVARPQQSITRLGTNVQISWNSIVGQQYQLQVATNLNGTGWTMLNQLTAVGSTTMTTNTAAQDERYYRVFVP